MDSEAEFTAIFTWLKSRSLRYPDESLHESFPSTQKPDPHSDSSPLGITSPLDRIKVVRTPHEYSPEKISTQPAVTLLE
jgi:hypothetical protein